MCLFSLQTEVKKITFESRNDSESNKNPYVFLLKGFQARVKV